MWKLNKQLCIVLVTRAIKELLLKLYFISNFIKNLFENKILANNNKASILVL